MQEKFARYWRILEYIKRNTDPEHPVSRAELLRDPDMEKYVQGKDTFRNAILNMANVLNTGEDGSLLPPEQWRIVYQAYSEKYGGDEDGLEEDDELAAGIGEAPAPPVKGLYYQHVFSYEEINALIEGVLFSRSLDTESAGRLVRKIEENLTTRFYKKGPKNICKVCGPSQPDWDRLRENLLLIQRAIDKRVKLSFRFNGYDRCGDLVPVHPGKATVSPYYIVADGGRYYLLACAEGRSAMSIWRIDLMTELVIPGRTKERSGERALEKGEVKGLPPQWDDAFSFRHLNMAFDQPVLITLRILNPWKDGDGKTWTNYTFMRDWFGDTFHFERTETESPYGDIVRVWCSPFAMVNWALQYSDRVEVLEPKGVREKVIEKIRNLERKYEISLNDKGEI